MLSDVRHGGTEMKRKKFFRQMTALALFGGLTVTTVLSGAGAPEVKAAEMTDDSWEEIQSIVGRYYGEWKDTTYSGAITDTMPNTALLGNGDLGITSGGNDASKTFYVSKGDFWSYTGRPMLIGGVTVKEKEEEFVETGENLAPSYKNVTASSYMNDMFAPELAVNGDMQHSDVGYGWVTKRPQDAEQNGKKEFWLQLEFEDPITIGRYVLKNDGAVRTGYEENNTSDFELQISDTGEDGTWETVDKVVGNKLSIFRKNLEEPVQAKFVRLFITKPTQETTTDSRNNPRARIGQFELYAEANENDPGEAESKNLALNKPIQVSGYIDNPGTIYHAPGEMLVDGNASTKWCSSTKENLDGSSTYWAMIDLGENKDISRWVLKHAQAGGEGAVYNTRDFKLQYTTEAEPDPTNNDMWIDADVVEGNTLSVTDRNLENPINTRYVRLHVTKATQNDNNAVRIYEMELYTDPLDPNCVFYEKQDILNAEIQTRQELAETPTQMTTWLSSDENVMVTELKSNGDEDAAFQVDTWASTSNTSLRPVTAANDDTSVTVTRSTENPFPEDENSYTSKAAMSTKIIGADDVAASSDNEDGRGSLTFTLPAGETVYIVTAVGGSGRTYHYDGSLWDCEAEPEQESADMLSSISDESAVAELNSERQAWWKDFWRASYIDFGTEDANLNAVQKYYYGAQYILGSSAREGKVAPGLYGIWHTTDNAKWLSDYHMNYNFIATFYGTYSSNRENLALPAIQALYDFMPEGQRRAGSVDELKKINADFVEEKIAKGDIDAEKGIEGGLLYPISMLPWGTTIPNAGYLNEALCAAYNAYIITQYYDYTSDEEFLASGAYEYLKQSVTFYESWLDKEETEDGYRYVLHAGYNEGSWAVNPAVELAGLKNVLKHLIAASEELGLDADRRENWIDIYEHLSDQPTTVVNGKTVLALGEKQWNGSEWVDLPSPIPADGNALPLDAIIPGGVYNYFSAPEDLQMVRDTIDVFAARGAWSQINNFPRLFPGAVQARYPADTIISNLANVINRQMAANLRINDGYHGVEKSGSTETVNTMLLLSEDGITKLFPNWCADKDAKFVNLRTKGAFVVSAEYDGTAQEAKNVTITSEAGEDMTLVSPWAEGLTVKDSEGNIVETTKGTVPNWEDQENATYTFATTAGETYTVEKGETATEKPSKNTLEYFLNKAKEHQVNGDVDNCVESIKNLFAEAIAEGEAVMADENATYDEVMDATIKLMKAIQALDIKAADKTDLEMAVELAQGIDLTKYVEAGQAEFQQALAAAQEVLADGDAMQADADTAWNALVDAISNLRLKADKSTLEDLLNSVTDLDLSQYTEESAAVFRTALANAQAVLADETLTEDDQKTVDEAVQALSDAKDQLELKDASTGDGNENTGDGSDNTGNGDSQTPGNGDNSGNNGNSGNNNTGNSNAGNSNAKADAPKTGDTAVPFAMLALAAGAVAVVSVRKKQSR